MSQKLMQALRRWRDEQARIEGVETYRVMNNATLEALVGRMPTTMLELLDVKGIKAAKSKKYGKILLNILETYKTGDTSSVADSFSKDSGIKKSELGAEERGVEILETVNYEPLTVSQFLDGINVELSGMAARIKGEVTSVDLRERVIYFSLKDPEGEGMVSCVIFRYQYQVSGVELAIGDEVIVEGVPEIYKPSGRFSLRVGVIELAGEGALKKAYDALKAKLEQEGLLAPERKRLLPTLIERVALVTSSDGAAIGDFTMNLGRNGIHVDFYPTAVEGKKAVFEIIKALQFFRESDREYDCLVLIRGGGSLESLQAFNSEALVREVSLARVPVLCGVGHEKDITLAALVADMMVSTPTATAKVLASGWEMARHEVDLARTTLLSSSAGLIADSQEILGRSERRIEGYFRELQKNIQVLFARFYGEALSLSLHIQTKKNFVSDSEKQLMQQHTHVVQRVGESLRTLGELLASLDPKRVLERGYALLRRQGKLVRRTEDIHIDETIEGSLANGKFSAIIKEITTL